MKDKEQLWGNRLRVEHLRGTALQAEKTQAAFFFFWERKGEERLEKEGRKLRLCFQAAFEALVPAGQQNRN